jgi:trehalose-6-phosphatase
LQQKLHNSGVTVSHSAVKGVVEVRLAGINKGAVADGVLLSAHAEAAIDFVLCIGDDDEDEYMLSAITASSTSTLFLPCLPSPHPLAPHSRRRG